MVWDAPPRAYGARSEVEDDFGCGVTGCQSKRVIRHRGGIDGVLGEFCGKSLRGRGSGGLVRGARSENSGSAVGRFGKRNRGIREKILGEECGKSWFMKKMLASGNVVIVGVAPRQLGLFVPKTGRRFSVSSFGAIDFPPVECYGQFHYLAVPSNGYVYYYQMDGITDAGNLAESILGVNNYAGGKFRGGYTFNYLFRGLYPVIRKDRA